jgi:superfamily II DNA or RNA helicase
LPLRSTWSTASRSSPSSASADCADYIHSREDSKVNDTVLAKLDRRDLNVIVQVRMLGGGFDRPYLSVAAVFSIFATLTPFVQFVGWIMRVIKQGVPGDSLNVGSVVFHAGANTVKAWDDLKDFAEADQEWFKLLTEQVPVGDEAQREVDPTDEMDRERDEEAVTITEPGTVTLEELPLLSDQPDTALKTAVGRPNCSRPSW